MIQGHILHFILDHLKNIMHPPRRSTFEQSHVKDRFNHKESVWSTRKKKEVVKQVYRVKIDGRKSATSDLVSS